MKSTPSISPRALPACASALMAALAWPLESRAQRVWSENGNGYVIMEAENTESDLGSCWKETRPPGFTGRSALENTCNNPSVGPPKQPIQYTIRIKEAGEYSLHLHIYKNLQGEEQDKCNDVYIRVEGAYQPGAGAPSLGDLKSDNKHYGGDHAKCAWSGPKPIDAHEKKWAATYKFEANQTYTLVMSGRAQRANINRLVFTTAAARAKAQDPATPESTPGPTGLALIPMPGRGAALRQFHPSGIVGQGWSGIDGRRLTGYAGPNGGEPARSAAGLYLRLSDPAGSPAK